MTITEHFDEFTLPTFIAEILNNRTEPQQQEDPARWQQVANIKRRYLRYADVTTIDEGRLLSFRLTLDTNWLNRYVRSHLLRDE